MDVESAHKIKTKMSVSAYVCVCVFGIYAFVCVLVCKYSVTFGEHESEKDSLGRRTKSNFI